MEGKDLVFNPHASSLMGPDVESFFNYAVDWIDERRYDVHLYITWNDRAGGWQTQHAISTYRAVLRDELTHTLERAGFMRVRRLLPLETGFYQPLVLAEAP